MCPLFYISPPLHYSSSVQTVSLLYSAILYPQYPLLSLVYPTIFIFSCFLILHPINHFLFAPIVFLTLQALTPNLSHLYFLKLFPVSPLPSLSYRRAGPCVYSLGRQVEENVFSESSTGIWAEQQQLPCCPNKAGVTSRKHVTKPFTQPAAPDCTSRIRRRRRPSHKQSVGVVCVPCKHILHALSPHSRLLPFLPLFSPTLDIISFWCSAE